MKTSVIHKIQQIASRIPGIKFMYDDWNVLNNRVNKLRKACDPAKENELQDVLFFSEGEFPLLFVLLQATGTFERSKTNNMRDWANLTIGVVVPHKEYDFSGMENVVRVEWAKDILTTFLNLYEASGMFYPLPNTLNYQNLYQLFDAHTTGLYVTFQAQEVIGSCLPILPDYGEPIVPDEWKRNCDECPPIMEKI